jgi:DNA-binding NtrC family response regulator
MKEIKVLLVDDEEDFVRTLAERLQLRGEQLGPDVALDGETALRTVEKGVPDVMVLDLRMPGIDGLEVLKRTKENYPEVQVIILTGHGSEKDEEEARRLGAYDYLQKPVAIDRLVETIRKAFQYKSKFEKSMVAGAFAEAGEFNEARHVMDEKES